jgi:phage tail tube protein FII
MSTDNNNNIKKQEQLKLDALNKIFGWIEDKETKAVMINKYYNNKEHRATLKALLDDMVKALDESTAETNSKEEIKRHLSYIIREIDPLY